MYDRSKDEYTVYGTERVPTKEILWFYEVSGPFDEEGIREMLRTAYGHYYHATALSKLSEDRIQEWADQFSKTGELPCFVVSDYFHQVTSKEEAERLEERQLRQSA